MIRLCSLLLCLLLPLNSWSRDVGDIPDPLHVDHEGDLIAALKLTPNRKRAKNIILFIGDGMGVSTVTAARILQGQLRGEDGEENYLSFEKFPYVALSKTYSANSQVAQSAATMSAIMTGVKTKDDIIALNDQAIPGKCASQAGNEVATFLEQAEAAGLSTGVVSTARITHATPAASYAHSVQRGWENDSAIPNRERKCKDIARQLVEFTYGDGLEVVLGGGRAQFVPEQGRDSAGVRKDQRDLIEQWKKNNTHATYIWNRQQLLALNTGKIKHVLGLFADSHMAYEYDRHHNRLNQPSLSEMTRAAISVLSKNPKGFFLMVEAGRIDHAHHDTNAFRALREVIELSNAVSVAQKITNPADTLMIVTADHSHTMTIGGYPSKGQSILGKVHKNNAYGQAKQHPALALDGQPYTILSYANRPATGKIGTDESLYHGRELAKVDTEAADFYQGGLVPLSSETHGGEDVAIYAQGPWAHLFHRTHEQSFIYYVMRYAAGLDRL